MLSSGLRLRPVLLSVVLLVAALAPSRVYAQEGPPDWTLAREISIGSVGGPSEYLFTFVKEILPYADGSVVVADARQRVIRRFGRDGAFEGVIGRDGGGPGEFRTIARMGLVGDTIWLLDSELRRTSLFTRDGELVSAKNWVSEGGRGEGTNQVAGLLTDVVSWGENDGPTARALTGKPEDAKAIVRMSSSGATLDTIAFVPTLHTIFSVPISQGFQIGTQPFSDAPLVVGAPGRSRLFLISRSASQGRRNARVDILALAIAGDTIWNRALPVQLQQLASRTRDSVVQRTVRSMQRSGVPEKVVRESLYLPDFRPPVTAAFASAEGTLWLQRETGGADIIYWIVSPDGKLQARVVVPSSVTLMAARGQHVWGVQRDADNVPSVVRWRVQP